MNLKLSYSQFEELIKSQYSLDHLFILYMVNNGIDIIPMVESSKRIAALYQTVIRKGLLNEAGDSLSLYGKELLTGIIENKDIPVKNQQTNNDFNEWWKIFPSTDTFEYNNVKFNGCRSLKQKKEECRLKFNRIVSDGEFTAEEIIDATIFDVQSKMKESIKRNSNKLTYLQNSFTYLNQRSFQGFVDLVKKIDVEESYLEDTTYV